MACTWLRLCWHKVLTKNVRHLRFYLSIAHILVLSAFLTPVVQAAPHGNTTKTNHTTSAQTILTLAAALNNVTINRSPGNHRFTPVGHTAPSKPPPLIQIFPIPNGRPGINAARNAHLRPSKTMLKKTPPKELNKFAKVSSNDSITPGTPEPKGEAPRDHRLPAPKTLGDVQKVNAGPGRHIKTMRNGEQKWETRRQQKRREKAEASGSKPVNQHPRNTERSKRQAPYEPDFHTNVYTDMGDIPIGHEGTRYQREVFNTSLPE